MVGADEEGEVLRHVAGFDRVDAHLLQRFAEVRDVGRGVQHAGRTAARGGADKITGMKSIKMTGKMVPAPGMEMPMTMEWKRPNKIRVEFTMQGMTGIQAFDGETGWQLMPFMGQTAPEKMADKDIEEIRDQADVEGDLFNYKEKGHKVEYVGTEDIEGTPSYPLRVTKKNGQVAEVYIETDSNLEIKRRTKREINGQQIRTADDLQRALNEIYRH